MSKSFPENLLKRVGVNAKIILVTGRKFIRAQFLSKTKPKERCTSPMT